MWISGASEALSNAPSSLPLLVSMLPLTILVATTRLEGLAAAGSGQVRRGLLRARLLPAKGGAAAAAQHHIDHALAGVRASRAARRDGSAAARYPQAAAHLRVRSGAALPEQDPAVQVRSVAGVGRGELQP